MYQCYWRLWPDKTPTQVESLSLLASRQETSAKRTSILEWGFLALMNISLILVTELVGALAGVWAGDSVPHMATCVQISGSALFSINRHQPKNLLGKDSLEGTSRPITKAQLRSCNTQIGKFTHGTKQVNHLIQGFCIGVLTPKPKS